MYFYCIMSYSLSSLGSLRSFILGEYRLSRVPLESGCITHLTGFHENILRHSLGNFVGIAFYVNLLSIILSVVYTSRKSVFWFFIRPISFFLFGFQIPGIFRLALAFLLGRTYLTWIVTEEISLVLITVFLQSSSIFLFWGFDLVFILAWIVTDEISLVLINVFLQIHVAFHVLRVWPLYIILICFGGLDHLINYSSFLLGHSYIPWKLQPSLLHRYPVVNPVVASSSSPYCSGGGCELLFGSSNFRCSTVATLSSSRSSSWALHCFSVLELGIIGVCALLGGNVVLPVAGIDSLRWFLCRYCHNRRLVVPAFWWTVIKAVFLPYLPSVFGG